MAVRKEEIRVTADVSNALRGFAAVGTAAGGLAARLEEADGRMAALVQSGLALAPALVPLGAAAVPAVAGLATQLGFAGLAAGTALLAFNGVGDALKALNDYQLEPSAANLEKLQTAFGDIGPAAQEFVVALDRMQPAVQGLQDLAAAGLFPGATEGLNSLMRLLPQVQDIIFTTASTMGDLAAEAGENLAGPKFQDFFNYLNTSARPILTDMGRTLGNFIAGIADVVVAFDPLSRSFSEGFLDMSRSFADWADGLARSQGFQEFVSYVQSSGPKAMDALGSIASALVELVEAAAPVGAVALPVISALADGLAAVADSPVGPVLLTAAAAVGTFGRALALLETVGLRGGGNGFLQRNYVEPSKGVVSAFRDMRTASDGLREAEEKRASAATKARDAQFALIPDKGKRAAVSDYTAALRQQEDAARRVSDAERARSDAIRSGLATAGKAAAGVAGLAVATTGLGDKMGISNAASLALMGTLAGPWGAALGGGVGLVMDLAGANNDLETAIRSAERAAASSAVSFGAQRTEIGQLRAETDAYLKSISGGDPVSALRALSDVFTNSSREGTEAVREQSNAYMLLRQGAATVYADLNRGNMSLITASDETVDAFVNRISPALQQAGIDVRKFLAAASGSELRTEGLAAIQSFFDNMASASGKSQAVGQALADIGHEATAAVDPVSALKSALDSLFGTEISQSAATDAWAQSLADLREQLGQANGQIEGQTQAARDNRAAVRDAASALLDKAKADADANVQGDKLAASLVRGRQALIDAGVAAGTSRRAMVEYVNSLGLTPRNLETIVSTPGLLDATNKVRALGRLYGLTPTQIQTLVKQAGAEGSRAKVKAYLNTLNLTPAQKATILKATDQASAKAKAAQKAAEDFAEKYQAWLEADDNASPQAQAARTQALKFAQRYLATLDANDPAAAAIRAAIRLLNSFDGRTATATMVTIRRNVTQNSVVNVATNPSINRPPNQAQANGGIWAGSTRQMAGGGWTDRGEFVPRVSQMRRGGGNILWSEPETGWEAYISGKPGMRERNLQIWREAGERLGAQFVEYARGGLTSYAAGGDKDKDGKRKKRKPLAEEERKLIATIQEAARRGILDRRNVAEVVARVKRQGSTRGLGDELSGFVHQINQTFVRGKIPKALQERLTGAVMSAGGRQTRKDEVAVNRKERQIEAAKDRAERRREDERQKAKQDKDDLGAALKQQAENKRQRELDAAHKQQQDIVDGLNKTLQENQAELDKETSARESLISTISSAYVQDPFGGNLSGFDKTVSRDTARVSQVNADFQSLIAKGLSGDLLTQLSSSGNDRLVRQFAQLSAAEIDQRERSFENRNALAQIAGQTVANQQFNASIQTLTVQVQSLTSQVAAAVAADRQIDLNEQARTDALLQAQIDLLTAATGGGGRGPGGRTNVGPAVHFHGPVVRRDADKLAKSIQSRLQAAARAVRHK